MKLPDFPARAGWGKGAFKEFDDIARAIIDSWERLSQQTGLSPQESANGTLKREAYRVICHYIDKGRAQFFEHVIRRDGRSLSSVVKLADNPFHYGLKAMFIDDSVITPPDRSLFANQMLYAYRHRVPPEHLVGFIYQSGSSAALRRKLKEGAIEPGFEAVYRREGIPKPKFE